jgi:signal peptidase
MFRVLETLTYTILVALLLAVVFLLVGTRFELPGGYQIKIVRSGSMEPAISTGSMILIKPQNQYRVGDIITFGPDTASQIPTTHRIVAIETIQGKVTIATMGDANEEWDQGTITVEEIIGKVLVDVPSVGYVLDFARQPLGFALLIGLPALIIILDEFVKIIHEIARMHRNKRMAQIKAERLQRQPPPPPPYQYPDEKHEYTDTDKTG